MSYFHLKGISFLFSEYLKICLKILFKLFQCVLFASCHFSNLLFNFLYGVEIFFGITCNQVFMLNIGGNCYQSELNVSSSVEVFPTGTVSLWFLKGLSEISITFLGARRPHSEGSWENVFSCT